jgi:hypothetical protein
MDATHYIVALISPHVLIALQVLPVVASSPFKERLHGDCFSLAK